MNWKRLSVAALGGGLALAPALMAPPAQEAQVDPNQLIFVPGTAFTEEECVEAAEQLNEELVLVLSALPLSEEEIGWITFEE